jgi:hypothetical protein
LFRPFRARGILLRFPGAARTGPAKSSLVEATLALMPPECQLRVSSLTGQALYYMGVGELKHKALSVAE